jgi:hypothetical protein
MPSFPNLLFIKIKVIGRQKVKNGRSVKSKQVVRGVQGIR